MTDEVERLRHCVQVLADALRPHLDDWDEWSGEDYNNRHRAEIGAALDEARSVLEQLPSGDGG